VQLGDESIVGALSFIKEGEKIPPRSLVAGNPGKIIRQVSNEMLNWKTQGTQLYQQLPTELHESLQPMEPLREMPPGRETPNSAGYESWTMRKKE
jgi:carbonic anhydrase/acetyltransferase-like protein (isoleucine patch superfamily)